MRSWYKNMSIILLIKKIEDLINIMVAVATGGPQIQKVNSEYMAIYQEVENLLLLEKLENPNEYRDLWRWYGRWSRGDLPTYQSRREYIANMYDPLLKKLHTLKPNRTTDSDEKHASSSSSFSRIDADKNTADVIKKQYDVFICHASEDKESFVRSLANELRNKNITVWYDEFTLKLGDSLRKSIDKGLVNSRYGIVVLSKNFFVKNWPEKELNGLTAREDSGKKVILPIWHEITKEEVLKYSPILADRLAISTSEEMAKIVESIIDAIGGANSKKEDNIDNLYIPKEPKNNPWRMIRQIGLVISIIAASTAILAHFGLKPKPNTNNQIAQISFKQSRPYVDQAVMGNDQTRQYWPVYLFKVRIFNTSYDSGIRAKYLKLTDLRKLDGDVFRPWENAIPAILEWPAGTSKELSPREDVFVPFARIFPIEIQKTRDTLLSGDIETLQLRFVVAIWNRQMTSHVPPGTYCFKLTVFFENEPPAESEFQLEWSGEGRENLDSMAKNIKIKQIN